MKKKSENSRSFKLSHDFDAFAEFLDKVEQTDDVANDTDVAPEICFHNSTGVVIVFNHPQDGHTISAGFLMASTIETLDYYNEKISNNLEFNEFKPLIAFPGDKLAGPDDSFSGEAETIEEEDTIKPKNNRHLLTGAHVRENERSELIADQYGFVTLNEGKLSIQSPLKVSKDLLRLDWLLPGEHPQGRITLPMLEFWLQEAAVRISPDHQKTLMALIENINNGIFAAGANTIVRGVSPIHGEDGFIQWHIDIDQSPGKLLDDGRIDFRERNFVVNVTKDQRVATVIPPTKGTPGIDIFGNEVAADDGKILQLVAENNVRTEQNELETSYFSEMDGAIHLYKDTLSVTNVLTLEEGVNFGTGNIDFAGDVVVIGIVLSGFSVCAGGDIIVTDSIENGAFLKARGNIVIGVAINGMNTMVQSGLSLRTQYVNEATVKAGTDIIIGSYARHAKLRAIGVIQVNRSIELLGGAIIGGETWATQKIIIHTAGSEAWVRTELIAGILPEQIEKLDQLKENIEAKNTHIRQILDYFGIANIDLKKLKAMIENAEGMNRKSMALRAKYLANAGKQLQQLLTEKAALVTEIGPAPVDAEIQIQKSVYPNVIVRLGSKKRSIDSALGPTCFQIDNEKIKSAPFK
ncbi:DUF342 domain-containing protein [Desulfopila sp. IMCC35008]|uniref:DUF342 domain-containing protein n=1 Tax=Desulfopila sp. IMCC35008 TaxID=2653858 RepID=UPI0013D67A64|nr:FapA family protein [Desulfopila sp. IMCC35008]